MNAGNFWGGLFRPATAGSGKSPAASQPDDVVIALLQAFMNAADLGRMQAIVKKHPELLDTRVDEILKRAGDERTKAGLMQFQHLFRRCREAGVELAFEEAAREGQKARALQEICLLVLNALLANSLAGMEQAIRRNPRVIEASVREACRRVLAANSHLKLLPGQVEFWLGFLERCDAHGLDATLREVQALEKERRQAPPPPAADAPQPASDPAPTPTPSDLFNAVIAKFNRGGADAEVAAEAAQLYVRLPRVPRNSCILVAMIASFRDGFTAQARQWAVVLNCKVGGIDLPGLPQQAIGPAVLEGRDFALIVHVLEVMSKQAQGMPEEAEAIRSLLTQYRNHRLKVG